MRIAGKQLLKRLARLAVGCLRHLRVAEPVENVVRVRHRRQQSAIEMLRLHIVANVAQEMRKATACLDMSRNGADQLPIPRFGSVEVAEGVQRHRPLQYDAEAAAIETVAQVPAREGSEKHTAEATPAGVDPLSLVGGVDARKLPFGKGIEQPVEPRRGRAATVEPDACPVFGSEDAGECVCRLAFKARCAEETGASGSVIADHQDFVDEESRVLVLRGRQLERQERVVPFSGGAVLPGQNEPPLAVRKVFLQPGPGEKSVRFRI